MAEAMVCGLAMVCPWTMGAAPGGLEAHHVGQGAGALQTVVFHKALPVGGDIAGIAHRNEEVVRGVAEHVGDFKGAAVFWPSMRWGLTELTRVMG